MPTTLTSREFNQDASRAKRAALSGPVFVTDRGRPTHVLLSVAEYDRLAGLKKSVLELLAMPEAAGLDLTIAPRRDLPRPLDLG
jgi:prevent-host-death family protein